jgi:hypothetical protein
VSLRQHLRLPEHVSRETGSTRPGLFHVKRARVETECWSSDLKCAAFRLAG